VRRCRCAWGGFSTKAAISGISGISGIDTIREAMKANTMGQTMPTNISPVSPPVRMVGSRAAIITQLATITLASANNPYGVLVGAILGHAICAAIAVTCGKLIAGRISERLLTAIGGILFIGFGILAALNGA